jgi:hypothetical protein
MATVNELHLYEVSEKIVAIVKFGPAGYPTDGTRAGDYYQVTIDPANISPSGEFIRFGMNDGDEIVGWQRAEALTIVEVLGSWGKDGEKPLLQFGTSGHVQIPLLIHKDEQE